MNNKSLGAILLSAAGLTAALGTAGAQIAYAIVLGAFYQARIGGETPPSPSHASPHPLVFVLVLILAITGLFCFFVRTKPTNTPS
jgi:hypothetical protein